MPDAVHGASSRMASNSAPPHSDCHQSCGRAASATRTWAFSPRRCRVSPIRALRVASISSAVTCRGDCGPAISSRCAVLPPGAAQASSTRRGWLRSSPCSSKGAACWAAASCTDTQPSAKCGRDCTGTAWCRATPCSPTALAPKLIAPKACRYCATVHFCSLTRSTMGAWALLACRICSQCWGWSLRRRCTHQAGWFQRATGSLSVAATRASRSRRKRRRQPLMNEACARVAGWCLAASTAWFTRVKGS